ncbi:ABC transporter permease [Shewanella schlegeliana]|uniref:Transport permease protein n=1 Tax=Shewanella schlegeliana TaxID=190308 RepID=A0ABS1SU93_9GAMM|nr:ABC transporter permease [Shewanella schlegeliana]MBL4912106.1 ABC transporter permease [Shewanella schlegeliana]MCL1111296.1 ABC transporter permease [Shewanella schlegeliana]GIU32910.1 transport permease protein [Shewanella schlegeliana]
MNALFALISARNLEFVRDKSALGWSLLFPIIIIVALVLVFDDDNPSLYQVGVYGEVHQLEQVKALKHIEIIYYEDLEQAKHKVSRHLIDGLLSGDSYWVNPDSAQGYILEQVISAKLPELKKRAISGKAVRHVEWLLPGIIGMNMMFSALYGVGYVVVRYRRTGVLKRLQVTPLAPWLFLASQLFSRLGATVLSAAIVFVVIALMFDIRPQGNVLLLVLNTLLGSAAMISIGLLVASRTRSDELCNGLLNVISWPMMFLSGIWFSLEGSKPWVRFFADCLPLTHMNDANRAVIIDGAGLLDIGDHLLFLVAIILICLGVASRSFRWD